MKRIFAIISLVALFAACEKPQVERMEEGQDCVVTFNILGDISVSEDDLTKSTPSANDLYAVQVYKAGSVFASGIFDDISLAKLNLKMGSTYSVRICMVRDAKTYLGSKFSLTNNGVASHSSTVGPYYWKNTRGQYSNDSNYYNVTNILFYNSNGYTQCFNGATVTSISYFNNSSFEFTQLRTGYINNISYPTCTDWFYGEVNGYVPDGETGTMDVVLKRTGFKLKYELSGVTDGEVTVKVYNSTRTFIANTTNTTSYESEEQFIAFYDTYSAWKYADNYTENMTVAVTWKRSIGVTQDLGTKTIQIKRNCLNNIRITLGSDDKSAGVSLETEAEDSMGSNSSTIPVNPAQ